MPIEPIRRVARRRRYPPAGFQTSSNPAAPIDDLLRPDLSWPHVSMAAYNRAPHVRDAEPGRRAAFPITTYS
ncbi:hypothetical protein VSH64_07795 [Amycolatopsis rhabdoformis]|uniref:Uncharacterized protein n=1 Tax=Amycolatopsis rhabdoformis TaxID=1448059 RepID=A0ABZ1IC51_9PSEU|nr:hypothetical protein [Amycolatopsis rhabdoformis]WSE32010.1 hypothetical protein VSH64_07795 [Amycolatopsis rhabdoformis]